MTVPRSPYAIGEYNALCPPRSFSTPATISNSRSIRSLSSPPPPPPSLSLLIAVALAYYWYYYQDVVRPHGRHSKRFTSQEESWQQRQQHNRVQPKESRRCRQRNRRRNIKKIVFLRTRGDGGGNSRRGEEAVTILTRPLVPSTAVAVGSSSDSISCSRVATLMTTTMLLLMIMTSVVVIATEFIHRCCSSRFVEAALERAVRKRINAKTFYYCVAIIKCFRRLRSCSAPSIRRLLILGQTFIPFASETGIIAATVAVDQGDTTTRSNGDWLRLLWKVFYYCERIIGQRWSK